MSTKKDFLKLLAKTSVIAMTALTAGNVIAADITINNGTADLQSGTNTNKGRLLDDNDTLVMNSAQSIDYNATPALVVGGLDLGGFDHDGKTISVTGDADAASIGAIGNAGDNGIALNLAAAGAAYTFSLTGTKAESNVLADDYSGLGAVTIGKNATLNINATNETTIPGLIYGGGPSQGILQTNAQKVTFSQPVGATNPLAEITTNAGEVMFSGFVRAATITTDAGKVTFSNDVEGDINLNNDYSEIDFADGCDVAGAIDNTTSGDYAGILNFLGAGSVSGAIGASNKMQAVNTAAGEVTFSSTVDAGVITTGTGEVTFDDDVDATNVNVGAGRANFDADVNSNISMAGDSSIIKIKRDVTGDITTKAPNKGVVEIDADATITGEVGADGSSIEKVHFLGDHTLELVGDAYGNFTNATANHGTLNLTSDLTIKGDIGTSGQKFGSVTFAENTITFIGNAYTDNGISLGHANSVLNIGNNSSVDKIVVATNSEGEVQVVANATGVSLGSIGEAGKGLGKLTVNKSSSATITENAYFDTTGIHFAGNGTLEVSSGKTLNFANGAAINSDTAEEGTLILNGQTISSKIGLVKGLHTIRAFGDTEFSSTANTEYVEIGTDGTVTASNVLTANKSIKPVTGATNTKFVVNGADSVVGVGAGSVGALSEVNFATDNSLTIDAAGTSASFEAVKVTANTSGEGTLIIKTNDNGGFLSSNIGEINGNKINKLDVQFQNDADTGFELRGDHIHAGTIYITGENTGDNKEQGLILGKNANNSKYKPQILKGSFSGNPGAGVGGGQTIGLDIQGHTAINGDMNGNIAGIRFDTASNLYYNGTNNAASIDFNSDGSLYVFSGDTNISSAITTSGKKQGSIIATGVDYSDAENAFLAGDQTFEVSSKKYTGTLTLSGDIAAPGSELKLLDVGTGTVSLQSAGFVGIDKVIAHKLSLAGAATYDIDKFEIDVLEVANNINLPTGSELLGTKDSPLAATLSFSGGPRTITIEDKVHVNINDNGSNAISGDSQHILSFQGESDVYSQLGTSASKFDRVDIDGADKTVTLHEDVHVNTALRFGNGTAMAEIYGNVYGAVTTDTANEGILKISGSDKEITSVGAVGRRVNKVILNADKAKVTGAFKVNNVDFTKDGVLTITDAANALINTAITTSAGADTGTLLVENGDFTLNANVGTDQTRVKAIKMGSGTNKIEVAANKVLNTSILESGNGLGVVSFAGASASPNLDIGSEEKPLSSVAFGGAVTFRDAHAQDINVNANAVSFRKANGTTNLTAGGVATVLDKGYISAKGNGTVTVTGATATLAKVGESGSALNTLNINTASSVVALDVSDVHAATFNHANATVNAAGSMKVHGDYNPTNAIMSAKGPVTVTGDTVFDGTYKLTSSSSSLALDLSGSNTITINNLAAFNLFLDVVGGASIKPDAEVISYNVDYEEGNAFDTFLKKTNISTNHAFRKVSLAASGKKATLIVEDNTKAAIESITLPGSQSNAVITLLADPNNDDVANDLGQNPADQGGYKEAVSRFAATPENMAKVTDNVTGVMEATTLFENNRINSAIASGDVGVPSNAARVKAESLGVAAGDASERFGVWGNVIGGMAKQESRKGTSPFRSTIFGGIVGVDTLLDDRTMVGFAVGNALSNVKYKGAKSGDKIKTSSWVFSTYGSYSLNDNWFIRGNLTAASNKIDSKEKRVGLAGITTAKAGYNVEAYSAEAALGYNYRTDGGGTFTPSVGLKIARVSDIKFTETGSGVQNKEVSHKATNVGSVRAGASYTTATDWNGILLHPEAHMNLQYGLGVKTPKGKYRALGSNTFANYQGQKSGRFTANFGASVTSHVNNVEYGVGYDLNIADKYLGHQGSVKVKVKF